MKKVFAILLTLTILTTLSLSVHATTETGNVYEIENVSIIFDSNSTFDSEKQEYIANYLVFPEYGISTAGLMCTLFGHKNTSETVITITHKVVETSPRCLKETFSVTTCSRCDETSTVRTGFSYITCCPEE